MSCADKVPGSVRNLLQFNVFVVDSGTLKWQLFNVNKEGSIILVYDKMLLRTDNNANAGV